MAKAIKNQKEGEVANIRKTREGRIQKRSEELVGGVPTEMKKYKITELSALEGKVKKINTILCVDEEKNNGKSIMINLKTSTFEIAKQNLLGILEKHQLLENVKLVRTAKASTDNEGQADIEYHVDLDLVVDKNIHALKLKCYNTNCRIQVQHMGKSSHTAQNYLNNKSPVKYLAEDVLYPIVASMNDDINIEKEKEMVLHLKKELTRLKKMNKNAQKQNKKEKCVNSECKYQNSLDISNMEKYGKCKNCDGYEHFNCANIQESQRKEICLNGSKDYLCTECLTKYPTLALELVNMDPVENVVAIVQEESTESSDGEPQPLEEQNSTNTVNKSKESQNKFKCQKCELIVKTANQLETHTRLQHTEVINHNCEQCQFKSNTKEKLDEHLQNIHADKELVQETVSTEEQRSTEYVCSQCEEILTTQENLEEHLVKHAAPGFICGGCDTQCQTENEFNIHI